MIRRFFCILAALALTSAAFAAKATPVPEEDALSPAAQELVRLHVVAESDAESAQTLKLKVRDAVLAKAQALLADCESAEDAWRILQDHVAEIETAAADRAAENGYDGPVTAQTGVFKFPDRDYGGVVVPAGDYRAVRVVLGGGEGHNWWCVLYPTLCMPEEEEFHSILADWFERWFGGNET